MSSVFSPLVVDLSEHDEAVDFARLARSGIVGVIHRATLGTDVVDEAYRERRQRAREAGLLWGAYHVATGEDVGPQVTHFLANAQPDDTTLLALVYEANRYSTMSLDQARRFLGLVGEASGRRPVLYSGSLLKEELAGLADDQLAQHRLWWCRYHDQPELPPGWGSHWLWQYTGDGDGPLPHTVDGVPYDANLSVFAGTAEQLAKEWGGEPSTGVLTATRSLHAAQVPLVADLSHHNTVLDLKQTAAAGLKGVIHKATEGTGYADRDYVRRRAEAKEAGLLWGAYHFGTGADVKAQVEHFLRTAQPDDNTLLVLDFEDNPSGATMSLAQAREFLGLVAEKTGRKPALYSGKLIKERLGSTVDPFFRAHRLWLSHYNAVPKTPACWEKYWLWQYTGDGLGPEPHSVPGIRGKIDLNAFSGTPEELAAQWVGTIARVQPVVAVAAAPAPAPAASAAPAPAPAVSSPAVARSIAAGAGKPTRFALVVGNGAYVNAPRLVNPVNDAAAVASKLTALGYGVDKHLDLPADRFERSVSEFLRRLQESSNRGDTPVGVFHFAGHGVQVKGENYLLPVDADVRNEMDLRYKTIAITPVLNSLVTAARTGILLLDCCRNNPLPQVELSDGRTRALSSEHGLAAIRTRTNGAFVAFATAPDSVAEDGQGSNSPFTQALIANADREVSIFEMMIGVRNQVYQLTSGRQVPWEQNWLFESVALNPTAGNLSPITSDPSAQVRIHGDYWNLIKTTDNPDLIRSFVQQFPNSEHKQQAYQRIDQLSRRKFRSRAIAVGVTALLAIGVVGYMSQQHLRTAAAEALRAAEKAKADAEDARQNALIADQQKKIAELTAKFEEGKQGTAVAALEKKLEPGKAGTEEAPAPLPPTNIPKSLTREDVVRRVSAAAADLIIASEIGSKAAYERRYTHPAWAGAQTGVLIGIGYDLGYVTERDFAADWQSLLPENDFSRLAKVIGVQGPNAKAILGEVSDISVPWEAALSVFTGSTLAKYAALVDRTLPNTKELPADSFGALVSLVYNRGASFTHQGDRYTEMRRIRELMEERKFGEIPDQLRAMNRLWPDFPGLQKRHDAEAALFERGLVAQSSPQAK